MEEPISLYEVLVKTNYLTQITELDNLSLDNPIGFGSGFIVEFENENFFVTADHTIHLDDYKEIEQRTWKEYRISIFNNYTDPNNFLSTLITPLGGFYFMEQFKIDKPKDIPRPIDVSVCKMKPMHFEKPFLSDKVTFPNGETIEAGQRKFIFKQDCFSEPDLNKVYFIFGKIHTKIVDNITMKWTNTLKSPLKFVSETGDFLLLNTLDIIDNKSEWEGLSGSPVISEDGECIGVLCDVLENSKSIWVMPISKVKMFIEVAILQDKLNENKKHSS